MNIEVFVGWFYLGLLPASLYAQILGPLGPPLEISKINGQIPAETAYIVKYYVDKPSPDSRYETGNLHIVYSDDTEIIERLLPRYKCADEVIVYNQKGITDVKVAPDKRTIGWTETFDRCLTPYSLGWTKTVEKRHTPDSFPFAVAIYRPGRTVLHILQGEALLSWTFRDNGKHVATVWRPWDRAHAVDYRLFDVKTGYLDSEFIADPAAQVLSDNAPEWAKETERQK